MTIPARLLCRPTYNGWVIPYTTLIVNGIPDFKITDMTHWNTCVTMQICGVCGTNLDPPYVWYIGSAKQADDGLYFDPAMHEECARYSGSVCPFIALGTGYAPDSRVHAPEGHAILAHASADFIHRPPIMVLTRRKYAEHSIYFRAGRGILATGPASHRETIGAITT